MRLHEARKIPLRLLGSTLLDPLHQTVAFTARCLLCCIRGSRQKHARHLTLALSGGTHSPSSDTLLIHSYSSSSGYVSHQLPARRFEFHSCWRAQAFLPVPVRRDSASHGQQERPCTLTRTRRLLSVTSIRQHSEVLERGLLHAVMPQKFTRRSSKFSGDNSPGTQNTNSATAMHPGLQLMSSPAGLPILVLVQSILVLIQSCSHR